MPPASLTCSFYERTDGNSWISDPIVSGSFTLSFKSAKPPYVQVLPYGNCLELVGRFRAGYAGTWPVLLEITEPGDVKSFLTLNIEILPWWQSQDDVVDADDEALGEFYYELCGGPLRKEFQWET